MKQIPTRKQNTISVRLISASRCSGWSHTSRRDYRQIAPANPCTGCQLSRKRMSPTKRLRMLLNGLPLLLARVWIGIGRSDSTRRNLEPAAVTVRLGDGSRQSHCGKTRTGRMAWMCLPAVSTPPCLSLVVFVPLEFNRALSSAAQVVQPQTPWLWRSPTQNQVR
jgi:hypothetical protein